MNVLQRNQQIVSNQLNFLFLESLALLHERFKRIKRAEFHDEERRFRLLIDEQLFFCYNIRVIQKAGVAESPLDCVDYLAIPSPEHLNCYFFIAFTIPANFDNCMSPLTKHVAQLVLRIKSLLLDGSLLDSWLRSLLGKLNFAL